ncbi:MAG: ATP-binding protein, partial [Patescibacteria group bacterium]
YIDEFQNFTTDSISIILSDARKSGWGLPSAHQVIAPLEDKIRDSVFGNVGSMIAFRVGMPDTEVLVKQFGPEFDAQDLISTENQHALAKLLINGEPSRPFNLECQYVSPAPHPELRAKLEELSRLTYGRDLAEVEQDIVKRLRGV